MPTPLRTRHRLSPKTLAKLAQAIPEMSRDSALYRVLRDGLRARGNWKQAPRGDPQAGHKAAQLDRYAIRGSRPAQTYEPVD
jgi:hypothetical protein